MLVPVVLSGGSGTRLWPVSRRAMPKQFRRLVGPSTMVQATVARLDGMAGVARPVVVCNAAQMALAAEQLADRDPRFVVEPSAKNTAPAIAAACGLLAREDDPVVVVLPSDHVVEDVDAFRAAVDAAVVPALDGYLVTFGIVPDRPATGFGYIAPGAPLTGPAAHVSAFVEKPDVETATRYVADGYLWNSGMFVFRASAYLDELRTQRPDIAEPVAASLPAEFTDVARLDDAHWSRSASESIDFAVMEGTERAAVVPLDAGWSDVGSWRTLLDLGTGDADGNVIEGSVLTEGTTGSYVRSEGRLVATVGVSDLIVVETDDAVLVLHKDHAQDVKAIVDRLPDDHR